MTATFTQSDIGSILHFGSGNMELHSHFVRTFERLTLIIVDAMPSDGEIDFFWQAERRSRWSTVRILFMLVSPYTCRGSITRLTSPEPLLPAHFLFSACVLARKPIT